MHTNLPVDCPVWLRPEDVVAGRDTVVEEAIAWIQGTQPDPDTDGIGGSCDNCAVLANPDQMDIDLPSRVAVW